MIWILSFYYDISCLLDIFIDYLSNSSITNEINFINEVQIIKKMSCEDYSLTFEVSS